jgi:O-antigen ligase
VDGLFGLISDPSNSLSLLIFVVGNRLQRVLVAYQAFMESPLSGVGLGALKAYSSNNFNADDFSINGVSAYDFIVESNAANVFVEVAAEAGVIGFIGFMAVLFFIQRKKNNHLVLAPFKIAFYVTMAALLIDSSYLRTYVWALYGVIIGLSSLEKARVQEAWFYPARLRKYRMLFNEVRN